MKYNGAVILEGGMESWNNNILFPGLPSNPSADDYAKFEKIKEVSKFFGGSPQVSGTEETKPKFIAPKTIAKISTTLAKSKGRKKREGC